MPGGPPLNAAGRQARIQGDVVVARRASERLADTVSGDPQGGGNGSL